jgi:oxygen-independent coproporphyrinogen-3 oxidase
LLIQIDHYAERTPGRKLATRGHPDEPVTPAERRDELLMMGLRLAEGVSRSRSRLRAELGADIDALVDPAALSRLVGGGFLALDSDTLRATPAGLQRLNAVLAASLG